MIQRIQSLFFLASAIAFASLFKLPFATSSEATGEIYQNKTLDLNDNMGLLLLAALGVILSMVVIFLFKNRKLQSTVGYISLLIGLALTGFAFYVYSSSLTTTSNLSIKLGLGMAMPVIAAVLALLGSVFTKKDEKLVKSMDRLR